MKTATTAAEIRKELNLGYSFKKQTETVSISFYKEHGVYVVTGFVNTKDFIRKTFDKFSEANKYFKSI